MIGKAISRSIPEVEVIILNETEEVEVEEIVLVNETINDTVTEVEQLVNITKEVPKTLTNVIGVQELGLSVYEAPTTNLKKGLDLQGGTRVLMQPEEEIDEAEMDRLIFNLEQRLNVYGLSDIVLRKSSDISGNNYTNTLTPEGVKSTLSKRR